MKRLPTSMPDPLRSCGANRAVSAAHGVTGRHDGLMATTVLIKVDGEDEANAWASVLRTLGLEVSRPTDSPVVSGDGKWVIRARTPRVGADRRAS